MNVFKAALKYHKVSVFTILLIFIGGIYSLVTMPRRASPEITIRQALVIAIYPGATAQQVEEQVTKSVENKLFTYSEVKKDETYSTTKDGLVVVTVTIEDWVDSPDLFWERLGQGLFLLSQTDLPKGVLGPIVDSDFGDVVALIIAVETDNHTYNELKTYVETIENNLRKIPSVSKINKIGFRPEEISVTTSSEKLVQYGFFIEDVIKVLETQNTIKYSGYIETDYSKITLHTTGLFTNIDHVKEQIIGISPDGSVVRIKDVAKVERKLTEATQYIRTNGKNNKTILISLQMQPGHNIVDFGKKIDAALEKSRKLIPRDVNLQIINNQPQTVKIAVNDFLTEFLIAVVAVILVIILLLPLNIALIAAISIPVSIGMTFSFLNLFGFEMQQVSLASLIVVLGMVVDNAIVVIDDYISKLDEGLSRYEAAWRSVNEFSIPLFSSTLTIIMAFLPLVFMLTGPTGQFLISLPITVAISMSCSLVVAFFLTPFLAFCFIKKGLKKNKNTTQKTKKKFSLLDIIQHIFDKGVNWAMQRRYTTIILAIAAIILGVLLMKLQKQEFFPSAQRSQFIIQIFEPLGTKLDITDADARKIEQILKSDSNITSFATFVGTSAPRVYYSFSPVFPEESYAMFLINTTSVKETSKMAVYYKELLTGFLPNAQVDVMEFVQGVPVVSPVEVRIFGDNITEIKTIGEKVIRVFRNAEGSRLIRQDFEDNYLMKINVDEKIANQLGFTTEVIADLLAIGFHGATVTTLWEGDNSIDITFRLGEEQRKNFSDIINTYITSPITKKHIPLRQIAKLTPMWQTGKITRRNGIPTLTIGCKTKTGYLSSEVLNTIQPGIDSLSVLPGYEIVDAGVIKNQKETFGKMIIAIIISLVCIFLILLYEFKDMIRPLIIMVSIPLTLFGSLLGLLITGNVFSFTAFVGLIALVGIVIRNALIIVEYSDELVIKESLSYKKAALESAKRRLRPIFLTTMAAAIGVVPMIIMKDPLWAPLASVFAFGIVFSMVLTLLVIPVLYSLLIKPIKQIDQ